MALNQRVVSSHFPYLPLHLVIGDHAFELEALLDTGFDGYLALPEGFLPEHEPDGHEMWRLADGSEVVTAWHVGQVGVGDLPAMPAVVIILGDEPLAGLSVAAGFSVLLDHGRRVVVEP